MIQVILLLPYSLSEQQHNKLDEETAQITRLLAVIWIRYHSDVSTSDRYRNDINPSSLASWVDPDVTPPPLANVEAII